jgi:hypothetical protein
MIANPSFFICRIHPDDPSKWGASISFFIAVNGFPNELGNRYFSLPGLLTKQMKRFW